mmetsp:Transcript_38193/g.120289  ORF Transcript_38193/g.120289 Transcript_38193/m.120289 type:complete len:262 (+) Transcript_38193:296-1081(+)
MRGDDPLHVPPQHPLHPAPGQLGVGLVHEQPQLRADVELVGELVKVFVLVGSLDGVDLHLIHGLLPCRAPLLGIEVKRSPPVPCPCFGDPVSLGAANVRQAVRDQQRLGSLVEESSLGGVCELRGIEEEKLVLDLPRPGRNGAGGVGYPVENCLLEVVGQPAVDPDGPDEVDEETEAGRHEVGEPRHVVEDAGAGIEGGLRELVDKGAAEELVLEGGRTKDDVLHVSQGANHVEAFTSGSDGVVDEDRAVLEPHSRHPDVH